MVQKDCINSVYVVCGPTASGKTALSIELAKKLNGEIICADSLTVYKGLDIGTAKIKKSEMQGVPHYLLDVVDIHSTFSVGDYKDLAMPILKDIFARGKTPIICGGTGFYVNSLLFDYSYGKVSANLEAREKYFKLASEFGNQYVFDILKEKDYNASLKLHPNDLKRVVRALEIYESGILKSSLNDGFKPLFDYKAYMIDRDRDLLYDRIEKRVDKMIESGLIEEVKGLINLGLDSSNQCLQGIGYKEIYSYLIGNTTLTDAINEIKLNTRHYAKRQITFFKKMPNIKYIPFSDAENMLKFILEN